MKLLFMYVERQRVLGGAQMNFDSAERFHINSGNEPGTVEIGHSNGVDLGSGFFSASRGGGGVVESVSAVVGRNGAGKTSIASSLFNLGKAKEDGRKTYVIIIYRSARRYVCVHGGHWKILTEKLPHQVKSMWSEKVVSDLSEFPFLFLYYSPFMTTENVFDSAPPNFIDVSTGALLRACEQDEGRGDASIFDVHTIHEHLRVLRFLSECHRRKIRIPKSLKFRLPVEVELKIDIENLEQYPGSQTRSDDWDGVGPFDSGGVTLVHAFQLANSQYLPFQIFGFVVHVLLDALPTFDLERGHSAFKLCSACRKIAKKIENTRMEDSDCRECFKEIEKTLGAISLEGWAKLNKRGLVDFFKILNDYYVRRGHKLKRAIRSLIDSSSLRFYPDNPEDLRVLERLAVAHSKIGYAHDVVRFRFSKMSSGEMALLTMFARLYGTFHPIKDDDNRAAGFKDVLVYMDEAETTLHPAWQRVLVLSMIWFIEEFAGKRNVQLVFASHSPVLLSDIPAGNVLYLHQSKDNRALTLAEFEDDVNTFGANIFDLYAKKFNLPDGTVGAFAGLKIDAMLRRLAAAVMCKGNHSGVFRPSPSDKIILSQIGDHVLQQYFKSLREGGLICDG